MGQSSSQGRYWTSLIKTRGVELRYNIKPILPWSFASREVANYHNRMIVTWGNNICYSNLFRWTNVLVLPIVEQ